MFAYKNSTCTNPCGETICCSANAVCLADDDNLRCISEQGNIAALVLAYGILGFPIIAILAYILYQQSCLKSISKPLVTIFNLFSTQDSIRSNDKKMNRFVENITTDVENNGGTYQPPL